MATDWKGMLAIWDLLDGNKEYILQRSSSSIVCFAARKEGIITGHYDGRLDLWC